MKTFMPPLVTPLLLSALLGCAAAAPAPTEPASAGFNCSAAPPIRDIWALEPSLKAQGKISDEMTREEKERVIKAYIRERNAAFVKCKEGK